MQREFIFTDKWLDLLFENRNRSYGAYMLRKRLPHNILIGYMVSVIIMGTTVCIGYRLNKISVESVKQIFPDVDTVRDIYRTIILPDVKSQTKEQVKKNNANPAPSKNTIPVIVDNDKEDKTDMKKQDDNPIMVDGDVNKNKNDSEKNNGNDGPETGDKTTDKIEPFLPPMVEKMPEFPGGELSLIKFLKKNTQYPVEYLKDEVGGTVWVSFVIDTAGAVGNIKVVRGVENYPQFEEAAIRSISKMPKWKPGIQNKTSVSVLYTLPVRFSVKK